MRTCALAAQSAEDNATRKGLPDTCGNSPKNLQEQQFFRRLQKVEQESSRAKRYLLHHHQLLLSFFFQIPILAHLSHSHSRNSNGIGLDWTAALCALGFIVLHMFLYFEH